MPLQATSGAASYDAFGGGVPAVTNYIEDVFSTWLYNGKDTSGLTITNGIDLSSKGGMVWIKGRNAATTHSIQTSALGTDSYLRTQTADANTTASAIIQYDTTGFTLPTGYNQTSYPATSTYVSWTFRKQPKFFDVVTWTGNGANRTIAHALGSVPACIIVKRTDTTGDWQVYHRSLANTEYLVLNSTAAKATGATRWNSTTPTSTVFSVGTDATVNASGGTYVAYVFAHDAGGFGLTGTDNVISCGTFSSDAGGLATVNLSYEPQWVLFKGSNGVTNWQIVDNMRGFVVGAGSVSSSFINANTTAAESTAPPLGITNTGFDFSGAPSVTYIYIAIRRGPMKVPTTGTSVFGLSARTGTGANATVTGGQTDDAVLVKNRGSAVGDLFASRLTGTGYVETSATTAEVAAGVTILQANPWDVMDGVKVGTTSTITNASANTFINYLFKRAPSFMDVVCYTGTGASLTVNHNLAASPELIITKRRDVTGSWRVFCASIATPQNKYLTLNATDAVGTATNYWPSVSSTTFGLSAGFDNNNSGGTFVAYLFATLSGVSKVGSYTGNGSNQTINCGFTGGARFILIKRTDSTGDWYVWDTARGIVAGNDPHLSLNTTAAEVTSDDTIDTDSTGFIVNQLAATNVNVTSATYIFLAIA